MAGEDDEEEDDSTTGAVAPRAEPRSEHDVKEEEETVDGVVTRSA